MTWLLLFQLPAYGDARFREQVVSIFTFDREIEADYWMIVNDSVMGGVSRSQFTLTESGAARFEGILSLANNGGFASVRTYPVDYRLDDYDGVKIRFKGDGRQYKLRLRTDRYFNGISYEAKFDTTPDTWMTIRLPFDAFVPVYRGRLVRNAPVLDPANITQMGLMISDKIEGPFQLDVDGISAYRLIAAPSSNGLIYY